MRRRVAAIGRAAALAAAALAAAAVVALTALAVGGGRELARLGGVAVVLAVLLRVVAALDGALDLGVLWPETCTGAANGAGEAVRVR